MPAAVLLAACAAPPLLPYQPDAPLTAQLPLSQAGVRDERAGFASLFERELKTAAHGDLAVDSWLHLPAQLAVTAAAPSATAAAIQAIDQGFAARRAGTAVLVVPGLFGDCVDDQSVPFGDGLMRAPEVQAVQAYAGYADLGLHSLRLVRLPGRQSVEHNGTRLAAAIREVAAAPGVDRIVLVAYSKGVPDAQQALALLHKEHQEHQDHQEGPRASRPGHRVAALVSVAGAVLGTPLADHFQPLYDALSPRVAAFGCTASDGQELASITRRERLRWLAGHPPVPGPAYFSIVAYAEAAGMALPLRASHAWLARADPRNDGQLLASDAVLPGSTLLAAARSDHWDLALPRDRHPSALVRSLGSGRAYPREALLRATLKWVIGQPP